MAAAATLWKLLKSPICSRVQLIPYCFSNRPISYTNLGGNFESREFSRIQLFFSLRSFEFAVEPSSRSSTHSRSHTDGGRWLPRSVTGLCDVFYNGNAISMARIENLDNSG